MDRRSLLAGVGITSVSALFYVVGSACNPRSADSWDGGNDEAKRSGLMSCFAAAMPALP
jgi:hypothetical protein